MKVCDKSPIPAPPGGGERSKAARVDWAQMRVATRSAPLWLHFDRGDPGASLPARYMQRLLEQGDVDRGIIAASELNNREYALTGSVAELVCPLRNRMRLQEIFCQPSLQIVSIDLAESAGSEDSPGIAHDLMAGPNYCVSLLGRIASLLLQRFESGALPLSILDLGAPGGRALQNEFTSLAQHWEARGACKRGFCAYLNDPFRISFPAVATEASDSCEIEDAFPNGRPPLESAGVRFLPR